MRRTLRAVASKLEGLKASFNRYIWEQGHTAAGLRRRFEGVREAEPPPRPALPPAARHGEALRPQTQGSVSIEFETITRMSLQPLLGRRG